MVLQDNGGGTEDIWKWIASGLLAVLGWLLGKKDRRDGNGENSWENKRSEVILRISQLEELNKIRIDHPEYHPMANYVNGKLGKYNNRIEFLEGRITVLEENDRNGGK